MSITYNTDPLAAFFLVKLRFCIGKHNLIIFPSNLGKFQHIQGNVMSNFVLNCQFNCVNETMASGIRI